MPNRETAAVFLLLFSILTQQTFCRNVPRIACEEGGEQPKQRVITADRLRKLRNEMTRYKLDAYFVPSTDPHLNEYIGPEYARRKWISGFSGSQGEALVMKDEALVSVDSRYITQANLQMDCNWKLMTMISVWNFFRLYAAEMNIRNARIGVNTNLLSGNAFERIISHAMSINATLISVSENLIDNVWTDRPRLNSKLLFVHPLKYAGTDWQAKVRSIRSKISNEGANAFLVTKLDEIAWLFNLRGSDIPYTPVFYAYALVQESGVTLFLNNLKAQSPNISRHLNSNLASACPPGQICVRLRDYDKDFPTFLDQLLTEKNVKLWISESSTNAFLINKMTTKTVVNGESPIYNEKVIKKLKEAESFEKCTHVDSAAYVEFMSFLFKAMAQSEGLTEVSAARKLEEFRHRYGDYYGPSFETISSSGPNAAMNHYAPTNLTDRRLSSAEIYLLDAGSQFLGCTTDVTRTVHFGTPSAKMIDAYTRVLAGFITVATSVWPSDLSNGDLAINARWSLWQDGLDYGHSTGHGVGTFLSVHEFPNGLMRGHTVGSYLLRPGNYQSCEPGYYEDGKFGIRLETVLGVKKAETKYHWNYNSYLTFFPVALVPFERKLIDVNILSKKQIEWLNSYHQQCLKIVGDILRSVGRTEAMAWLEERTAAFPVAPNSGSQTSVNLVLAAFCYLLSVSMLSCCN